MIRSFMLSAAWLCGGTILAGLSLRLFSGDEVRVARYVGYVMPWLLVGVVPGAAWAWRIRARALLAVLAASAALIAIAHLHLFRRPDGVRPPSAPTLSVMSYNTWSRNEDERRIARVVREAAPDLVLLQEIPAPVLGRLVPLLRDLYGGGAVHFAYEPAIQQAVVSRYPLEESVAMREKGHAQRVVVRTPAGPVTVLNVHALRERGWRQRYERLAAILAEDVLPLTGPVIFAGDLNAPEHSQPYALVAAHLENAHRAAGSGLGFTYPAPALRLAGAVPAFPVVRIDHVFFSRHFVALRAETLADSGGSDHRPVLAVLALAASEGPGGDERGRGALSRGPRPPGTAR
jgi:vancomycin resistance protein VanJ